MKLGLSLVCTAACAFAATACFHMDPIDLKIPKDTSEVGINQISVDLSAQSYEDGKVSVFGATYTSGSQVPLGIGDAFLGSIPGAEEARLSASTGSDPTRAFTTTSAPPFDVTIAFARAGAERAVSTVTLPLPPHVVAAPEALAQGQDLVIDLDAPPPSGVKVRLRMLAAVQLFGDDAPSCLSLTPHIIEPTTVEGARITVASATLFAKNTKTQTVPMKSCSMTVGVRFETTGHRADALGGGSISGLVERPATKTPIRVTRTDQ